MFRPDEIKPNKLDLDCFYLNLLTDCVSFLDLIFVSFSNNEKLQDNIDRVCLNQIPKSSNVFPSRFTLTS